MHSVRGILSTTLLLALLSPVLTHPSDQQAKSQEAEKDAESLQRLLDQVDAPSLHAALHDYAPKKFQHGMFSEDRSAVKAIHSSEPQAAHKIIELAKRQDGGVSNSSASASPSPSVAVPVAPISQGSTLGSVFPPSTSSIAPTSTVSSTEFSSTASLTSFSVSSTSSEPSLSSSSSESSTAPSSSTSSVSHTSITSTAVQVTTLPNGSQSTVTAITVVGGGNAGASTPTGEAGAGTGTGNSPSLQTGEAVMSRSFGREGMAVLVGALGFAAMM